MKMIIQVVSVVAIAHCAIGSGPLTDHDVNEAKVLIQDTLRARWHETRHWEPETRSEGWLSKHQGGTTAISTLAMLESGESPTSSHMKNALRFLWEIKQPSTYVLAIRTSIWAALAPQFDRRLQSDVRDLVDSMNPSIGGWGSTRRPPTSIHDTSPLLRELCVMGLIESHRCGADIPRGCWGAIAESVLKLQRPDGGWSPLGKKESSQNMSIAGINCLLSVAESIGATLESSESIVLHRAISNAIQWLQHNVNHTSNYGGTTLMSYFFALERAAMSCGLTELNGLDWFHEGVQAILETHCKKKKVSGSQVNLAFALLFLSRGHASITISELGKDKGLSHPHRMSDVLSTRLSKFAEQALSWQLVTQEDEMETWHAAPLLLIHSFDILHASQSKIQQYIAGGGTVVLLMNGSDVKKSIQLINDHNPEWNMLQTNQSHWSKNILKKARGSNVTTWNDGLRDCILLIRGSVETVILKEKSSLSHVLFNICMASADFGGWRSRMWNPPVPSSQHKLIIAMHQGKWDRGVNGFNRWNVDVKPIEEIAGKAVVIVGSEKTSDATESLTIQLIAIAQTGATIIVESIGGSEHFAQRMMQLVSESEQALVKPVEFAKKYDGKRGMTRIQNIPLDLPLGVSVGDGNIIFVDGDLRHSLMGHLGWGIHGYDMQYSMQFIDDVLENSFSKDHIE